MEKDGFDLVVPGLADQVFWWRLAAHGFGLVDDRAEGGWRKRPAYEAFRFFVQQMRESTFVKKETPEPGIEVYWFEQGPDKCAMAMAYCTGEPRAWMPGPVMNVVDSMGQAAGSADSVMLGPRPLYVYQGESGNA